MFPSCLHLISRRNRTQSWAHTRQLPRLATIGQKKPCLSTCRDFMVSNVHFDCQGRNFLVFQRITDDLIRFCALSPVAMLKQLSQAQLNRRVLIDVMSDATPCDHCLIQVLWQLFWLLSYYLKVSCSLCTVYSSFYPLNSAQTWLLLLEMVFFSSSKYSQIFVEGEVGVFAVLAEKLVKLPMLHNNY